MADKTRVMCWLNRQEWLDIYQCLYSFNDEKLQKKGLDRVMAWKSRSGGKLPLAIESTTDLVRAHLNERESSVFTAENQLSLAMALVRFVNGMSDMNQRGLFARSVQSIAEEIGLPDWLVDLRHEATHATLPSHDVLQAGLKFALSWLRDEYWEAQNKLYSESEKHIDKLLGNYVATVTKKEKKKKCVGKIGRKIQSSAEDVANYTSSNYLW